MTSANLRTAGSSPPFYGAGVPLFRVTRFICTESNISPRRGRLVVARRFNGGKKERKTKSFLAPQAPRAAKRSAYLLTISADNRKTKRDRTV